MKKSLTTTLLLTAASAFLATNSPSFGAESAEGSNPNKTCKNPSASPITNISNTNNSTTNAINPAYPKIPPQILEKYDVNKNGQLDPSEIQTIRNDQPKQQVPPQILEEFDKNKDGELDKNEQIAMLETMKERRAKMIEKFDTDKDGKLNPKEVIILKESADPSSKKNMERFDVNKNGSLDPEEQTAAHATLLSEGIPPIRPIKPNPSAPTATPPIVDQNH